MKTYGALGAFFFSVAAWAIYEQFYFVDFDQSMHRHTTADLANYHPNVAVFKRLFERNYFCLLTPDKEARIPKIIHQIWLGSKVPLVFKPFMESWIQQGWRYELWTDARIEAFGLRNKKLYDEAKNYGQRSDIARYEILERYGGLYVDVDFECLKPFDLLHHCCDFYTGLFDISTGELANGLIACQPGHPIIRRMVAALHEISESASYGDIIQKTGPIFFTKIFLQTFKNSPERALVFPCTFFYPSPNTARYDGITKQRNYIQPESLAIHYWACSWQMPGASARKKGSK